MDYKSDEAYKIAVYPAGARTMTEIAIATKAMEGGGYYNRHAGLQAAGIEIQEACTLVLLSTRQFNDPV